MDSKNTQSIGQNSGSCSLDAVVSPRLEACKQALRERWLRESEELLTAAGVPVWVEVHDETGFLMPGSSLPHRLKWFLSRRKSVAEHEKAGVCSELNALEVPTRANVVFSDPHQHEQTQPEKH